MKNKEIELNISYTNSSVVAGNLRYIKACLELREKKENITYGDIAGRIGKSPGAVAKWFSGTMVPSRAVLNVIAAYANSVSLFPVDITASDIANRDLRAITDAPRFPANLVPVNQKFLNNFNIIVKHMAMAENRPRLSREEIARRMGLKKNTIAKWYSKGAKPSLTTMQKICDYVNQAGIFRNPVAPIDLELGDLAHAPLPGEQTVSDVGATSPREGLDDMQRLNRLARRLNPDARAALIAFLESVT